VILVKAIELLSPVVKKLIEERGFSSLTPPQEKAIPLILSGYNVLIVAPTGTGKTEAAIIPLLDLMLKEKSVKGVKLIYVTPLRALNRDILERIKWWFLKLDFKVAVRHGDTPVSERRLHVISLPDVLVTTPESLQLLFLGRRLREIIRNVRWVIIDEVHEIASSKRGSQLSILLEKLKRHVQGREIQIIGLSATVGNPEEVARFLAGSSKPCKVVYVPVAKRISINVKCPRPIPRDYALASKLGDSPEILARIRVIRELLENNRAVIIFTNTRPTAEMLASRFKILDLRAPIDVHHGSLSADRRQRAEIGLKSGGIRGLVSTSSMELGIDVGHVDLVIQYNSPRQVSKLVQRIGRSGHRLGEVSRGVVLALDSNDVLEALVLKKFLREERIEPIEIPSKPFDVLAHEIVGLFISERRRWLDIHELYLFFRKAYPFRDLKIEEFNKLIDFLDQVKILRRVGDKIVLKDRRYAYKYFYGTLSMIPELKQYIVIDSKEGIPVGILDDTFVSYYCELGVKFIMGGRPWRIVEVLEETIKVESEDDYKGAIPSWVGEEIPVPFEVAQEVGKVRGCVEDLAAKGWSLKDIVRHLVDVNEWKGDDVKEAVKDVYKIARSGLKVPSNKDIIIEGEKGLVIVHMHFGTRVNRTFARYLAYSLSRILGSAIVTVDKPYAIALRSNFLDVKDVEECLKKVSSHDFKRNVIGGISESRLFKWRLAQVARRMGIVDPDTRLSSDIMDKLVSMLKGTPAYEEALKEVLNRDLDLARAIEVVKKIEKGEIVIHVRGGFSSLAEQILYYVGRSGEVFKPDKREVLENLIFKARVLSERITVGCLSCGYVEEKILYEVGDNYHCPKCGSNELVFSTKPVEALENELEYYMRGEKSKRTIRLKTIAALYEKYGLKTLAGVVLGLPLTELRRLLKAEFETLDEFMKELRKTYRRGLLRRFTQRRLQAF